MAEVRSESLEARRTAAPPAGPAAPWALAPRPPRVALAVKHSLDKVVAAAGLIVTAPLLALLVGVLRWSGTGQVLQQVERVGEDGRMIVVRWLAIGDEGHSRSRAWRRLAGTGIAALPQLWSVVRGDMSIIGPRPRRPGSEPPLMRPGLTGLTQLEQLERWVPLVEQLELDLQYSLGWSLALDARIVWRTMWCGLR